MRTWVMLAIGAIAVIAACGPMPGPAHVSTEAELLDPGAQALVGDVAHVRALFGGSVDYGGLWFDDAACHKEFLTPRTIPAAELDAFAACVAGLRLARDARRSSIPDFALFTSPSGVELEARFTTNAAFTQLVWIGYVGSADGKPTLPTVTPATFGAPTIASTAGAWFKVCIDRDGAITGAHPIGASSDADAATFAAAIRAWHLRPVVLGGNAMPVCSWLAVGKVDGDVPVAPLEEDISMSERKRVAGQKNLVPNDRDKALLQRVSKGFARVVITLRYCIDPSGAVDKVRLYASSGLPDYDREVLAAVRDWKFEPGPRTCEVLSTIYVQQ